MAFCGKCGAPIKNGKFCPQCGLPINEKMSTPAVASVSGKKSGGIKKVFSVTILAILVVVSIIVMPHTVNKPCDWCNQKPSMEFKTSDGSMAYVCKDCRKECAWCGKKATKHYENLLGMVVFVCSDCYKEIISD